MTQPSVLIRLRPLGPWRYGTGEGGDHRLDTLFRSDRLYSAVTLAMEELDLLNEWLDATVRTQSPAVTFSSLFPFQGDTLFAPPPATSWPPPAAQLTSPSPVFVAKMRWEAARFIPLGLVESLITGQQVLADQWAIDAESGCLLRRDRPSQSPFRFSSRPRAAVDRVTSASYHADHVACVEFESGSGLWLALRFADKEAAEIWSDRLRAAFRILADTGFGGQRKIGWGQTAEPEWQTGTWPSLLLPRLGRKSAEDEGQSSLYWLLSLYSPGKTDQINWKSGDYRLTLRGGRVQSRAGSGAIKKTVRMITEGSVLSLESAPVGTAVDVAPDGFAHPVYRSGLVLALRLPIVREMPAEPAETTPAEGILEDNREREGEKLPPPSLHSDVADEDQPVTELPAGSESEGALELFAADLPATETELAVEKDGQVAETELAAELGSATEHTPEPPSIQAVPGSDEEPPVDPIPSAEMLPATEKQPAAALPSVPESAAQHPETSEEGEHLDDEV